MYANASKNWLSYPLWASHCISFLSCKRNQLKIIWKAHDCKLIIYIVPNKMHVHVFGKIYCFLHIIHRGELHIAPRHARSIKMLMPSTKILCAVTSEDRETSTFATNQPNYKVALTNLVTLPPFLTTLGLVQTIYLRNLIIETNNLWDLAHARASSARWHQSRPWPSI